MKWGEEIRRCAAAIAVGWLVTVGPSAAMGAVGGSAINGTSGWGIEVIIVCVFVGIIGVTVVPSVLLIGLELLQVVLQRRDPEYARHLAMAEQLRANPETRRLLRRFTVHQRVQHWVLVLCFTVLVVSGFPMLLPESGWGRWVARGFGGMAGLRGIHRWAGVVMLAGFGYHLVYAAIHIWRERRRTGHGVVRTILASPLVMNGGDVRSVLQNVGYLVFLRSGKAKGGRFSPGEKFEYFGFFWGVIVLGITGGVMVHSAAAARVVSTRVVDLCFLVHGLEAIVAVLHVGLVHLVRVILLPNVLPFSLAMITGDTPMKKLAEVHAGMVEEVSGSVSGGKTEKSAEVIGV